MPADHDIEKIFQNVAYFTSGVTGINPEGVYGKEEDIINSIQDELDRGVSCETIRYKILKGFAMKYIPEQFQSTFDLFIEVMTCPLQDTPLYVNNSYPVNSIAKKRLEIGR